VRETGNDEKHFTFLDDSQSSSSKSPSKSLWIDGNKMNLFELPDFSRATQDIKATTSSALQTPHLTATNELIYIYLVLDHK